MWVALNMQLFFSLADSVNIRCFGLYFHNKNCGFPFAHIWHVKGNRLMDVWQMYSSFSILFACCPVCCEIVCLLLETLWEASQTTQKNAQMCCVRVSLQRALVEKRRIVRRIVWITPKNVRSNLLLYLFTHWRKLFVIDYFCATLQQCLRCSFYQ